MKKCKFKIGDKVYDKKHPGWGVIINIIPNDLYEVKFQSGRIEAIPEKELEYANKESLVECLDCGELNGGKRKS